MAAGPLHGPRDVDEVGDAGRPKSGALAGKRAFEAERRGDPRDFSTWDSWLCGFLPCRLAALASAETTTVPFAQAFALKVGSRNCSPASDVVLEQRLLPSSNTRLADLAGWTLARDGGNCRGTLAVPCGKGSRPGSAKPEGGVKPSQRPRQGVAEKIRKECPVRPRGTGLDSGIFFWGIP